MSHISHIPIVALVTLFLPSWLGCQQEPEYDGTHNAVVATPRPDKNRDQDHAPQGGKDQPRQGHDENGRTSLSDGKRYEFRSQADRVIARLTLPPEALEGTFIETTEVRKQLIKKEIHATATIKPNQYELTHVSPRIQGKAIEVLAELGQQISPGETLALLDSLEVGQKKADYLQARTNLRIAKRNYTREQRLFTQKISSEAEYLEAKGHYERSVTRYLAAREALRMIGLPEHEIKQIRWSSRDEPLSHLHLTSPIAGTVIKRHITRGELITPKDKPFTIADLGTVWIILDIYEEDLSRVSVGSEVRISTTAYPDAIFRGTVVYLSDVLNPDTRTVDARVEIPNPDRRLRPGMFARASLTAPPDKARQGLLVPQSAVQHIDDRPTIFVQITPRTYEARHIELGAMFASFAEVQTGVSKGDTVVTKGSFYLKSILQKEHMVGHSH